MFECVKEFNKSELKYIYFLNGGTLILQIIECQQIYIFILMMSYFKQASA